MDFEEQLDLFLVRKENDLNQFSENLVERKKNSEVYSTEVFNCIPLMLKHVKGLTENWKDANIKTFSGQVQFRHCLVYGKIMGKQSETKSFHNYILDDGTAWINIFVFQRTNDIAKILEMENELQSIRTEMLAQNKNEIVNSLRNLLIKVKKQVNNNMSLGSNVLLYGKPTCFRGKISLKAYSFVEDGKCNRDIEISFKDCLINWYKSNCMFSTNCS